ncbi:unnamed protein product [Allacma fusca]|uniref:Uncharacterized protein n=1 Tax=Allacma fusca TaxID=39272 RepID=A0A8J2JAD6_9HEXA|nr:unnamed protein product [Allacma fusca]
MINFNSGICTFLITLSVVTGCFITNCPPGGKRSGSEKKIRQCEQCGPPGSGGRCYGPSICCSPELGCLIATPETYSCQLENRYTTLCQNPGASCAGPNGDISGGQCGAENICCNSGKNSLSHLIVKNQVHTSLIKNIMRSKPCET